jgi:hypothetical protein
LHCSFALFIVNFFFSSFKFFPGISSIPKIKVKKTKLNKLFGEKMLIHQEEEEIEYEKLERGGGEKSLLTTSINYTRTRIEPSDQGFFFFSERVLDSSNSGSRRNSNEPFKYLLLLHGTQKKLF